MVSKKVFISTEYIKFTVDVPNFRGVIDKYGNIHVLENGTIEEHIYGHYETPISEDIAKILNKYKEKVWYEDDEVEFRYG